MEPWIGLLLWFAVFIGGSIAGGVCSSKNAKMAAGCTSAVFILLSIAVFYFTDGFAYYGLKLDAFYTIISILVAFLASLPLSVISNIIERKSSVQTEPFGFGDLNLTEFLFLFLLLAPLGEEFLFRGILETSLLVYGVPVAVILPALLFSLMHIVPLKNAPRKFSAIILISAFILGLLAGYFRAVSGSLLPAYSVHAVFNLTGKFTNK